MYGATHKEWESWAGLALSNLLPIVTNPTATWSQNSSVKAPGKTPSQYNRDGKAVGIKDWPNKSANAEDVEAWKGKDLGICLNLKSTFVAIDVDVDDQELAAKVLSIAHQEIGGAFALRVRENSPRFAFLVRLKDSETGYQSRRLIFEQGGMVEMLGRGKQLVVAGMHKSGSRYEWNGDISRIPQLTVEQLETFAEAIKDVLPVVEDTQDKSRARLNGEDNIDHSDNLAKWLTEKGFVKSAHSTGVLNIVCPWEHNHTSDSGDTATQYFLPGSKGYPHGGFKCLHAHCAEHGTLDFVKWCESKGYETVKTDHLPVKKSKVKKPSMKTDPLVEAIFDTFRDKAGYVNACLNTVIAALKGGLEYCGQEVFFDTFLGTQVRKVDETFVPLTDADCVRMRARLEGQHNFKPISRETFRDSLIMVADDQKIDSMQKVMDSIVPAWDGVPRVEEFFIKYCGAIDDPHVRAIALYALTALWARSYCNFPTKADMVVVLVGRQGARKSTLVRALPLSEEFAGEISFNDHEDTLVRKMRGKTVIEVPEMSGMRKKETEDLKRFVSLTTDSLVPKYQERAVSQDRRCVFWMTTHDSSFLTDSTGSRRFGIVECGDIDIEAFERDKLQIYAEARELWKQHGIMYRDAELSAAQVNAKYERRDPWVDVIYEWIKDVEAGTVPLERTPEGIPIIRSTDVLQLAIGQVASRVSPNDGRRVSACMKVLGYEVVRTRVGNQMVRWFKKEEPVRGSGQEEKSKAQHIVLEEDPDMPF